MRFTWWKQNPRSIFSPTKYKHSIWAADITRTGWGLSLTVPFFLKAVCLYCCVLYFKDPHIATIKMFFFIPRLTSWFRPCCCQALKTFMQISSQYYVSFLCRCLHQIISNWCMNILMGKKINSHSCLHCWMCVIHSALLCFPIWFNKGC